MPPSPLDIVASGCVTESGPLGSQHTDDVRVKSQNEPGLVMLLLSQ